MKTPAVKLEGKVLSVTKNAYVIQLNGVAEPMKAYLSGKMMQRKIKPVIADMVEVEFDPSDLTKGRIVKRK